MAKEVQKEADRQRRLRAEKTQREQARAVMKNNRRLAHAAVVNDFQWRSGPHGSGLPSDSQAAAPGPIRQAQSYGPSSLTVNAAGGSYKSPSQSPVVPSAESSSMARSDWRRDNERVAKARRRDYDDDHSMSSDVHGSMSVISFATVDSDPGPPRLRQRPSAYGMNRMTSMSSMRGSSSIEDYATSGRSSTSLSVEQQLVNEFHLRASVDSSSISDGGSPQPPPMHMLSLSSPIPWLHSQSDMSSTSTVDNNAAPSPRQPHQLNPTMISPPPQPRHPGPLHLGPQSPYGSGGVYGPPSPGLAPKSAINPMFKVVSQGLIRMSVFELTASIFSHPFQILRIDPH